VALLAGDPRIGNASPEALQRIREECGLNKPLIIRYLDYLGGLVKGNLGFSFRTQEYVATLIGPRILATLKLAIPAGVLALSLGVVLGSLAAIFSGSLIDFSLMIVAVIGISAPAFWLAVLLMYFFAVTLQLLPPSGYGQPLCSVLPVLSLTIGYSALIARTTRASVLDVINEDYVTTARGKGVSEARVLYKHVFRNAILPIMTIAGLEMGSLFAGTVIIEKVFSWPGLGSFLVNSVLKRDIAAAQGAILIYFSVFVFINFLTDILYVYADPTITYE